LKKVVIVVEFRYSAKDTYHLIEVILNQQQSTVQQILPFFQVKKHSSTTAMKTQKHQKTFSS
jgi:hypothetical protein